MIALSHLANVLLCLAVVWAILRGHPGMTDAYGPDSPARRILACVYLSIGLISLYALAQIGLGREDVALSLGLVLFPLQILYKLLTAVAVPLRNPVVIANLAIVALHSATLLSLG